MLREHLALTVSGGLAALVTFKLFWFSGYNPETAAAIVQVAGTTDVLVGTVASMLPMLTVLALVRLLMLRGPWFMSLEPVERAAVLMAASIPAALIVFMVPIAFALLTFAALCVSWLALKWAVRRSKRKAAAQPTDRRQESSAPMSSTERRAVLAYLPVFVAYLIATTTWLPSESVTVGGGEPTKAYVVGTRGDETVFLPVKRHTGLVAAPTADVTRSYCSDPTWMDVSMADLLGGPEYPECP